MYIKTLNMSALQETHVHSSGQPVYWFYLMAKTSIRKHSSVCTRTFFFEPIGTYSTHCAVRCILVEYRMRSADLKNSWITKPHIQNQCMYNPPK